MITTFARYFGAPVVGQSSYVQQDPSGSVSGYSILAGLMDPGLSIPAADGYTISTWIKPDWQSGLQGSPVPFVHVQANSSGSFNEMWFAYDAETAIDALYIYTSTDYDGVTVQEWHYAPLVDDPYNQAITGLAPGTPGPNNTIRNSWNNSSSNTFTHIAATIRDIGASAATNLNDPSNRCVIYWNGQALNTYEYWSSGNPNWFTLEQFRVNDVLASFGSIQYPRFYWQDRCSLVTDIVSPAAINANFYAGGSPISPVSGATLHYNFENPNPYDSNGTLSPYTLVPKRQAPADFPILDSNTFV